SSDEDMGNYIRACDRVREAFKCAVLVIHHSGIVDTRPRGHTSLTGAADAQIAIKRHGTINTATVEYLKDGPDGSEGARITFRLEPVDVGQDEDGESITSCVVEEAQELAGAGEEQLSLNQQTMFRIIHSAGTAGLTIDEWYDQARA